MLLLHKSSLNFACTSYKQNLNHQSQHKKVTCVRKQCFKCGKLFSQTPWVMQSNKICNFDNY